MNSRSQDRNIQLAKVGKPHGIKGWSFVHYYGDDVSNFSKYKNLFTLDKKKEKPILIKQFKTIKDKLIVQFDESNDRDDAEKLRGIEIYISSKDLPNPKEGIYYLYELEGLDVLNFELINLGRVESFITTGANDVMVLESTIDSVDDRIRLIPYLVEENSIEVNLKEKRININWKENF
tara:strand:- start:10025 stop:10558 length:534 start_codon:yes stop_codon:yes gene_type:complete